MATYTVHEPPAKRKDARRGPDRFKFVRDGFYFWAFLLGPLWMLWHRLWLVLIGYLVIAVGLNVALALAGISGTGTFVVMLLLALLVGLEAGTLRRWTLQRRGWAMVGVVTADDEEAAARRFFDAWAGPETRAAAVVPGPPPASPPAVRRQAPPSDIVGLFPEPGASR